MNWRGNSFNDQKGRGQNVKECRADKPGEFKEGDKINHTGACCKVWQEITPFVINKTEKEQTDGKCFYLPDCMEQAKDVVANCTNTKVSKIDHIYEGLIIDKGNQKEVRVLRDTGASVHAVHEDLIGDDQRTGKTLSLITFGGRKERFDTARIEVDTPFLKGEIEACILKDDVYPEELRYYDVLIGNGMGKMKAADPSDTVFKEWLKEHGRLEIANEINTRGQVKRDLKREVKLKGKTLTAPLQETPVIIQPFWRCATDLIGPLHCRYHIIVYILFIYIIGIFFLYI